MKTFVQDGNIIELTAPAGGVVSGSFYRIGAFVGVAAVTAAQGERFNLQIEGVTEIGKVTGEPWTEGMLVYWNTGSSLASSVSSGTVYVGVATRAAVNPSTTGAVKLNYAR